MQTRAGTVLVVASRCAVRVRAWGMRTGVAFSVATEARLALPDRARKARRARDQRDHARGGRGENRSVALAGALHG
jgi:hypothetical protein